MMKQFLLIVLSRQGLILEAVTTNLLIISLIVTYASIFCPNILSIFGAVC